MFLEFISIFVIIIKSFIINAVLYEGDLCTIKDMPGICTNQESCSKLEEAFKQGKIRNDEIPRCGYAINKEIICCPTQDFEPATKNFCRNMSLHNDMDEDDGLEFNIYNGVRVQKNEYGFMAAVGFKDSDDRFISLCGGTIIANNFVLTAAHCLNDPRNNPNVVMLGSKNLNNIEPRLIINVKEYYIHSDFRPNSIYNDIGLLELDTSVRFTTNIYPICLYTNSNDPPANSKLYAAGWGRTEKSTFSSGLLKAELSLVSLDKCKGYMGRMRYLRRLENGVQDTLICANGLEQDTCQGDSGGPLLIETNQNEYYLIGIVSVGFGCGGTTPGLYTRVSSYLDFIESKVGSNHV